MQTADALIARIRRNIADSADATDMMFDIRAAYDREDWGPATEALYEATTPLLLDGVRYGSTFKAADVIDEAGHAVWDAVRDLIEPAIKAEAEATANSAIEDMAEGMHPDQYLSTMRYWLRACHPKSVYPIPLERLATWEDFRDASTAYIARVVQDGIHYAIEAEFLKDQLTAAHYRALTWPFDDLVDTNASEEI